MSFYRRPCYSFPEDPRLWLISMQLHLELNTRSSAAIASCSWLLLCAPLTLPLPNLNTGDGIERLLLGAQRLLLGPAIGSVLKGLYVFWPTDTPAKINSVEQFEKLGNLALIKKGQQKGCQQAPKNPSKLQNQCWYPVQNWLTEKITKMLFCKKKQKKNLVVDPHSTRDFPGVCTKYRTFEPL